MRIKTRRTAAVVIFTVLIALLSVLLLLPNGTATASAATTPLYSVQFSYTAYRGVYADSASIVQAEGTNVYETESFECGKASVETVVSFQIYGSTNSGTGKLPGGGYIGSNTVNLKVNGGFGTQKFEVKNSSGRVVGSATSGQCKMTSLADGLYSVSYEAYREWKVSSPIRDHPRAAKVVCSFQFRVDATKPALSGASTSTTGKYINKAFTVTSTDSGSGVDRIYWMAPGAGSYSYTSSSSKTISASSTNGLEKLRALKRIVEKKPFLTAMDEALFDEIVDKIRVGQDGSLTFALKCELKLRVKR